MDAYIQPVSNDLVLQLTPEDALELHGLLITSDGRSKLGDAILTALEQYPRKRLPEAEQHSVHADRLRLVDPV
jgi:hypothetical protein